MQIGGPGLILAFRKFCFVTQDKICVVGCLRDRDKRETAVSKELQNRIKQQLKLIRKVKNGQ